MNKRVELWEGWYFFNGVIYDDAGNGYSEHDIKMSWLASELVSENFGRKGQIKIMREELQREKIKALSLPKICLVWESKKSGIIEEVYHLQDGNL